jgi:hypothetical protein
MLTRDERALAIGSRPVHKGSKKNEHCALGAEVF